MVMYQPEERYHRGSLEVGIQEAWLGGLGEITEPQPPSLANGDEEPFLPRRAAVRGRPGGRTITVPEGPSPTFAGEGPRDTEFRKVDGINEASAQLGSDWAWRAWSLG